MTPKMCLLNFPDLTPHVYNPLTTQQLQTLRENVTQSTFTTSLLQPSKGFLSHFNLAQFAHPGFWNTL